MAANSLPPTVLATINDADEKVQEELPTPIEVYTPTPDSVYDSKESHDDVAVVVANKISDSHHPLCSPAKFYRLNRSSALMLRAFVRLKPLLDRNPRLFENGIFDLKGFKLLLGLQAPRGTELKIAHDISVVESQEQSNCSPSVDTFFKQVNQTAEKIAFENAENLGLLRDGRPMRKPPEIEFIENF
jgi:hypothetical protein